MVLKPRLSGIRLATPGMHDTDKSFIYATNRMNEARI